MANGKTITQRIALEGGKEIQSQLEGIGAAGQKAFNNLNDAARASPAIQQFGEVFDAIKAKAGEIGKAFGELGRNFKDLGSKILESGRNIGVIVGTITAVVTGFGLLIKGASDTADALQTTADSIGITTRALTELQFAAEQSGLKGDDLTKILLHLNRSIDESSKRGIDFAKKQQALGREFGLGKINIQQYTERMSDMNFEANQSVSAFSRLGIEIVRNADGTANLEKTLDNAADAFKAFPDGATKSALAMELFGSKNAKALTFINQGSKGLAEQRKEAQRVAPALSDLAEKGLLKLDHAYKNLSAASNSASLAVRATFAPVVTKIVSAFTESIVANRAAWISWANEVASKVTPIVNDLVAILQGRDQDVKNQLFLKARDSVLEFGNAAKAAIVDIIIPALQTLLKVLDAVAVGINAVFGTNTTGAQIAIALVITKVIGLFGILRSSVTVVVSIFRIFAVAVGSVTAALAIVAFAIGFFTVRTAQQLGGLTGIWNLIWSGIVTLVQGALDKINAAVQAVVDFLVSVWDGAVAAVRSAFEAIGTFIVNTFQTAVETVATFFSDIAAKVEETFAALVQFVTDTWNGLVSFTEDIANSIVDAFQSAIGRVTGFFTGLFSSVTSIFDAIVSGANRVGSAISSAISSAGEAGGATVQAARGGLIRGPGTGTSDSIFAMLSNREYVIRQKAVDHFGVGFFDKLNALRNPFEHFNMGGLVESFNSIMPRTSFADGGLATAGVGGGLRPLTFVLDGKKFEGLTGTPDVVNQLKKHAVQADFLSAGRKPRWYR